MLLKHKLTNEVGEELLFNFLLLEKLAAINEDIPFLFVFVKVLSKPL